MTVLHRQGFDSVAEVERCVLEPGGTFHIQAEDAAAGDGAARRSDAGAEGLAAASWTPWRQARGRA